MKRPLRRPIQQFGSSNALPAALYALGFGMAVALTLLITGAYISTLPSPQYGIWWAACIWLASRQRNLYIRVVLYIWCAWFFVGSLSFTINYADRVGLLRDKSGLDSDPYAFIYLAFTTAFIFGSLVVQYGLAFIRVNDGRSNTHSTLRVPAWPIYWSLLVFPVLYVASIYASLKEIPLFSGRNISSEMYSHDPFVLQPLAILTAIPISLVYLAGFRDVRRINLFTIISFTLALLALPCSIADGKRVYALFALVALIAAIYARGYRINIRTMITSISLVMSIFVLYVAVQEIRVGRHQEQRAHASGTQIGVEYWNSVLAVNTIPRNAVLTAGYDWPKSTLAVLLNRSVFDALGINRDEWIRRDSARVFMGFFHVRLGIRLGIISELWYAFEWYGLYVIFLLGVLTSVLGILLYRTTTVLSQSFLLIPVADAAMAITGQSTVIFGCLPTLLYAYIGLAVIDRLISPVDRPLLGARVPRKAQPGADDLDVSFRSGRLLRRRTEKRSTAKPSREENIAPGGPAPPKSVELNSSHDEGKVDSK
jgi:hypothetical protein